MADLAGFDAICEVHIDTVADGINLFPMRNPGGGDPIFLLGGPFSVELEIAVPLVGTGTLNLILEFTLVPMVHQSVVRFMATLKSGSGTLAGRKIDYLKGTLTLDVPVVFQLPPSQWWAGKFDPWQTIDPWSQVNDPWQIVLQMPAAQVECQFDAVTRAKLANVVKPADVSAFINALIKAIRSSLPSFIPLPEPKLRVLPGVDSTDPLQLAAVPIVAWIDEFTLGVFCHYSAGGGGSVSAKTQGDLYQEKDEFFYLEPNSFPVPSRRTALLISAAAAHRVLLCPLIKEAIVRGLRQAQELANRLQWVSQVRRDAIYKEKREQNGTAEARLQEDVQKAIEAEAKAQYEAWLKTASADAAVAAAVPPPCGTGSVEAFRFAYDPSTIVWHVVGVVLQDKLVKGTLLEFDVVPADGFLKVHYKVKVFAKILFGDVFPVVTGDLEIRLTVNDYGGIFATITPLQPQITPNASGLTAALTLIFMTSAPSVWQIALTLAQLELQGTLKQLIDKAFKEELKIQPTSLGYPLPQPPGMTGQQVAIGAGTKQFSIAARARDIQIANDSITLIALIARHGGYNTFRPALLLQVEVSLTPSSLPSLDAPLHLPATKWGCEEATFLAKRVFWDTEIQIRAKPHDLTMPVRIDNWTMEVGNVTSTTIGQFSVVDPRPRWSGAPTPITDGTLHLSGVVNHPDAPLDTNLGGLFPLGHLTLRNDIEATVSGADDAGWTIRFRAEEGNFFLRVSADATELSVRPVAGDVARPSGQKRTYRGQAIITVKGDQLQLPYEYTVYKDDCDAKHREYLRLTPPVVEKATVAPGEDVTVLQQAALEISQLVSSGDRSAFAQLEAVQRKYGEEVLRMVPTLANGPNVKRRG